MGGRKNATIAAAVTGMAALAIVPTWTDAARQSHHDGGHHKRVARNVIVLQGDGMATAQRDLIRLVSVGNKEGQDLEMNRLEHTGLVHTDPADPEEAVTDSAAAATAFSTGYKSFNGAIGVDAEGNPRPTLLEDARRAGKATGLVTTSQVTDATPAAYGAHVSDRARAERDRAPVPRGSSKPDVILGGGEDFWFPPGTPGGQPDHPATDPTEESKGDRGNLVERAQQLGYNYVSTREGLAEARGRKLLGLFANEEMFEHREEGDGDLYDPLVPLPEMATKALDVLSRDRDGLFVLIEEEGIDEMAHENNAGLMIKAGEALDQTVAARRRVRAAPPRHADRRAGRPRDRRPHDREPRRRGRVRRGAVPRGRPVHREGDRPRGVRRLDHRPAHRRRHADHGERPGVGALRRRHRQHRRPRRDRGRDAAAALS